MGRRVKGEGRRAKGMGHKQSLAAHLLSTGFLKPLHYYGIATERNSRSTMVLALRPPVGMRR